MRTTYPTVLPSLVVVVATSAGSAVTGVASGLNWAPVAAVVR
jgi:hypothetical protein